MTSFRSASLPSHPASRSSLPAADDDLGARCEQLSSRILDGIAAELDDLAQQHTHLTVQRAAIARAVQAVCAPLICVHAACRRAQACRHTPCAVALPGAGKHAHAKRAMRKRRGDFPKKLDYAAPMEPFWKKA